MFLVVTAAAAAAAATAVAATTTAIKAHTRALGQDGRRGEGQGRDRLVGVVSPRTNGIPSNTALSQRRVTHTTW